jgi:hypothetical protein
MENPAMKNYVENQECKSGYKKISAADYSKRPPIFNPVHTQNKSPAS